MPGCGLWFDHCEEFPSGSGCRWSFPARQTESLGKQVSQQTHLSPRLLKETPGYSVATSCCDGASDGFDNAGVQLLFLRATSCRDFVQLLLPGHCPSASRNGEMMAAASSLPPPSGNGRASEPPAGRAAHAPFFSAFGGGLSRALPGWSANLHFHGSRESCPGPPSVHPAVRFGLSGALHAPRTTRSVLRHDRALHAKTRQATVPANKTHYSQLHQALHSNIRLSRKKSFKSRYHLCLWIRAVAGSAVLPTLFDVPPEPLLIFLKHSNERKGFSPLILSCF